MLFPFTCTLSYIDAGLNIFLIYLNYSFILKNNNGETYKINHGELINYFDVTYFNVYTLSSTVIPQKNTCRGKLYGKISVPVICHRATYTKHVWVYYTIHLIYRKFELILNSNFQKLWRLFGNKKHLQNEIVVFIYFKKKLHFCGSWIKSNLISEILQIRPLLLKRMEFTNNFNRLF